MPAEKIDGQTVTFRPVRDGIDSEVSGVMQVIENANGFNVNASYIVSQDPPLCRVYWFDQSRIDAIARSAVKEKRRILIVDDDRESTNLVKILLEKAGSYLVVEENDPTKAHQSAQNFRTGRDLARHHDAKDRWRRSSRTNRSRSGIAQNADHLSHRASYGT